MKLPQWTALPTTWIVEGGLKKFRWTPGEGANVTAALMMLLPIAHFADQESGVSKVTYNQMMLATGRSREKVSRGLDVLIERSIIKPWAEGQSTYQLIGYDRSHGWGKLPTKRMYAGSEIDALKHFHLRRVTELDALKMYYLIVALRDRNTNFATVGYDRIVELTRIDRSRVKFAISLLVSSGMIHVERQLSDVSDYGVKNAYRLAYLDPYRHMGTSGRKELSGMPVYEDT
jgi:hypothetical protein